MIFAGGVHLTKRQATVVNVLCLFMMDTKKELKSFCRMTFVLKIVGIFLCVHTIMCHCDYIIVSNIVFMSETRSSS